MRRIENKRDLHDEIRRLEALKKEQEIKLRADVKQLGEVLEPANLASEAISAFIKGAGKKNTVNSAVDAGIEFLTDRVIFRKSGALTRMIGGMILKNLGKSFTQHKKFVWSDFFEKFMNDLSKDDKEKGDEQEEENMED